uniref:NADH-ubiquinone oxidoreductase chain 6 n=1 Tax=Hermerius intermedia TaxID=2547835 RepID=A0A7G8JRU2_9CUCU|nr:NADH dehydrogenase subunit 6 [Hermerius intermedia]
MTMNAMILIMLALSITFMFLNHPLSFGMILLMQTTLIAMITGMMNYNFWFSYIMFLIMVGGMLILFIYMTSIASNEKFKFSSKIFMFMLVMMTTLMPFLLMDELLTNMSSYYYELTCQKNFMMNEFSLSKFMNMPMNFNLILIIMYLLISLIMVVKLTNLKKGPLRQKF